MTCADAAIVIAAHITESRLTSASRRRSVVSSSMIDDKQPVHLVRFLEVAGQCGDRRFQRPRSRDPTPAISTVSGTNHCTLSTPNSGPTLCLSGSPVGARRKESDQCVREGEGRGEKTVPRKSRYPLGKGQAENTRVACPTRLQNKQPT